MNDARRWLHRQLDASARGDEGGVSPVNAVVIGLVGISLLLQILETERTVVDAYGVQLVWAEAALISVFVTEYVLRVWSAGEAPAYAGLRGRLRYMMTPFAVIDLLAILPSLISLGILNASALRALRILRILRFARFGALQMVIEVLRKRIPELAVSLGLLMCLVLLSATGMYLVEGGRQPETFGSIPRALWWSVITMTTVGYGDVTPSTPLGKLVGALVALAGVAAVAIPTGILAAAFSETMELKRLARSKGKRPAEHEPDPPASPSAPDSPQADPDEPA